MPRQYVTDWKDYYKVLRLSPDSGSEAIKSAYDRLANFYRRSLSDHARESQYFSGMGRNLYEAYQVLSDPDRRAEYNRVFMAKCDSHEATFGDSTREEILDLAISVAQDASLRKRVWRWQEPPWAKTVKRGLAVTALSLLALLTFGTSFAFAQPQSSLAAPFKGAAITLTNSASGAIGLIEDIRGVVATYEHHTISTALQSMRVIENVREVPTVRTPTNDMASFPSPEHALFPAYLDRRFSEFRYTADKDGIVSVDTSTATTDAFIEKIKQQLARLEEESLR